MKLYLDTNLVSAIVRRHQQGEADAVADVLRRADEGSLQLVTSKVTRDEIDRCTGPHRGQIQEAYEAMKKVPYVDAEKHTGFDSAWHDDMGAWSNPIYDTDPDWSRLRQIGLDATDAHHILLAVRAGCNIFLTCDGKTILNRRSEIEAEFREIQLMRPTEFVGQHPNP